MKKRFIVNTALAFSVILFYIALYLFSASYLYNNKKFLGSLELALSQFYFIIPIFSILSASVYALLDIKKTFVNFLFFLNAIAVAIHTSRIVFDYLRWGFTYALAIILLMIIFYAIGRIVKKYYETHKKKSVIAILLTSSSVGTVLLISLLLAIHYN